jgi:hypothetical protein
MNFIPDSGKYEIVSFSCPCAPGEVNVHTPLQRVTEEVVGWAAEVESGAVAQLDKAGLLPYLPVVLTLEGLTVYWLLPEDKKVGAPRLAKIGECTLAHVEAINLHRAYHEQKLS